MEDKIKQAYQEYRDRQDRVTHPDGKYDRGGRWHPSEDEEQECCKRIRPPSRAWPYSLLRHCCTLKHVANLYGVSASEIRRYAREVR